MIESIRRYAGFRITRRLLCLCLAVVPSAMRLSAQVPTYSGTEITFVPTAVNASGQIAGYGDAAGGQIHAVLYSNGILTDLGVLPGGDHSEATGINANGDVVGNSTLSGGLTHAFLHTGGVMQDIGTLPRGGTSYATAINDSGQITGWSDTLQVNTSYPRPDHAFLYSGGVMTDLGNISSSFGNFSVGNAINSSGEVVGWSINDNFETHAFRYSGGQMHDLGTLGGSESRARGINDNGVVVGWSYTANDAAEHAFKYAGSMIDLGTLTNNNASSALAINNDGQIVGSSVFSGTPAFTYTDATGMVKLDTHVSGAGWNLRVANAINSVGQIVVSGGNDTVFGTYFLLSPISAPMITAQPSNEVVNVGQTAHFNVAATGAPSPAYQWFKGATKLLNSSHVSGVTTSSLTITNVATTDAGTYSVILTNAAGIATSSNAVLTVIIPDTTKPLASITSPLANARSTAPVFAGTATDSGGIDHVTYWITNINNGTITVSSNVATLHGTNILSLTWDASPTIMGGTNILAVQAVDLSTNTSLVVSRSFFYKLPSAFTLTKAGTGNGTLVGKPSITGDIVPTNGAMLNIGEGYSVQATPDKSSLFINWTGTLGVLTNPALSFVMEAGTSLQANFISNPFIPVAGIYNGLFYNTNNLAQQSSGYLTLTVSSNQTFNGKLLLDGGTNLLKGKFNASGLAQLTLPRTGKSTLTVLVQLDLTNGTDTIIGTVSATNFVSQLTALRAVFNAAHPATNFSGNYFVTISASINAALAPGGYGYGLYKVSSNGVVAFSGWLGDGTTISGGGPLLKGGVWPLHARLYNGKGSFSAWANFAPPSEHVDAPFPLWFKNPVPTDKLYRNGFSLSSSTLLMNGAIHVTPPKGTPYLSFTNGAVHLADGNLPFNFVNNFTVNSNNIVTMTSGTNHLALSLNATNGTFTGSFTHPTTRLKTTIKGALVPDLGLGYFLGTNQSGAVLIDAQ